MLFRSRGSYPLVVTLFNVPDEDYRKFMRFLHKHDCHMPIQAFRMLRTFTPPAPPAFEADRRRTPSAFSVDSVA